tara:strand:+ start:456 stop:614 length:159 start_codon:yes stop_codon:yes gene_type:complete
MDLYWPYIAGACFVGVAFLFFSWLGCKSRKVWKNHLELEKIKGKGGYSRVNN